jgi:hypothetical protein
MRLPDYIPGLRPATILWAIYGAIWIALEGDYLQVVLIGSWTSWLAALHLVQQWQLKPLSLPLAWLGFWSLLGAILGALLPIIVFAFMSIKTGLHAHGPEFTSQEIARLWAQWPLSIGANFLLGLAAGLLAAAFRKRR